VPGSAVAAAAVAACRLGIVDRHTDMRRIEFCNLTLAYERHPAIHHLSTSLEEGSLTAIVGPNGSGKSTLLKALIGEITPASGEVLWQGLQRQDIAYLPQQQRIDRSFPILVQDFLLSGLLRTLGVFNSPDKDDQERMQQVLQQVGLKDFGKRQIGTLSGGQLQRLMFARLLLQDRPVLLLDEPFNAIDAKTSQDLLELLSAWHGHARTVVVVTHDLDQARRYFPHTLLLARELLAHGPTHEVLTATNLLAARRMCEAFDDEAQVCRQEDAA
jgi:zinc/manganese transport system ATP-binding protein